MNRYATIAALFGLLVWTPVIQAQEAVTIKLKSRGEGDTVLMSKTSNNNSKIKIEDGGGKILADATVTEKEVVEFRETIQKRDSGKEATKVERQYTKSQKTKDDTTTDSALHGMTVIIEKIDGKFTFVFKGGEAVTGAEAAGLQKEFNNKSESSKIEKLMLPAKAVKPGETWKLELPKILKDLAKDGDIQADAAKSSGEGKLVKTYSKDGKKFGVIEFKLNLSITAIGKGPGQMKFTEPAKMKLNMTLDTCIDGASEAGTMKTRVAIDGTGTLPSLPGSTAVVSIVAEESAVLREQGKK